MLFPIVALFGSLIVFLFLGTPIGFSIIISGIITMLVTGLPFSMMIMKLVSGAESFILTAIPCFTLAGIIMREGGITGRISKFCLNLVGHMKGSMGHVNIIASMIFGGISGSSVADTASIGNVLIPEMISKKYPKNFSAAITAVSSTIGIIIPPSIPMILYSIASETSIAKLFLAGAIPGVLVGLLQMVINAYISDKKGFPQERKTRVKTIVLAKELKHTFLAVGMPVVIVGGITLGIVTATEAAVLAVFYALVIGLVIYRELDISKFPSILKEVAITTGVVMLIVVAANMLGWILAFLRIPQTVSMALISLSTNPHVVLIIINIIMLIVGAVSDVGPNILILTPVFLPIVKMLGIDPVHFGIIMILNQAIALVTPPVGNCLYICSNLAKVSVENVFLSALPFLVSNVSILILVTHVPSVCMWLPKILLK
jgi:TRAP-type transport system large permease protein